MLVLAATIFAAAVRIGAPGEYAIERQDGVAVSPDGRSVAFVVSHIDKWIAVASTESGDVRVLPQTKGGVAPFWSPDSRTIGFIRKGELMRAAIDSGPAQSICKCGARHASWGSSGTIIFSTSPPGPIFAIRTDSSNDPKAVTADGGEDDNPEFFPDGERFIFAAMNSIYESGIGANTRKRVVPNAVRAAVLDKTTLLYQTSTGLFIVTGNQPPRRVATNTIDFHANGAGAYARTEAIVTTELVWVDRRGAPLGILATRGDYARPRVSPDGRLVVYEDGPKFVVREIATGKLVAHFAAGRHGAAWSRDSLHIAAPLMVGGKCGTFIANVADESVRKVSPDCEQLFDWSPDGRFIAIENNFLQNGFRFVPVDRSGESSDRVFLSDARQGWLRFSPNGTSVAFDATPSETSGTYRSGTAPMGYHVYIAALTESRPMAISLTGGTRPAWRGDGLELFFVDGERRLMSFHIGDSPKMLFVMPRAGMAFPEFDVAPDGNTFLINREAGDAIVYVERVR